MPIPKPNDGESESDFHARCMEAIGGEYEPDQANAICFSQYRGDKRSVMLSMVKGRTSGEFGYGITTADRYVEQVIKSCGVEASLFNGPAAQVAAAMKHAAGMLAFCGKDQRQDKIETGMAAMRKLIGMEPPVHSMMAIVHRLTTPREDRDGDTLQTKGARPDPKMPFLWQHVSTIPIGKLARVLEHTEEVLKMATVLLDLNSLTSDVGKLFEAEALRFSHGFIPTNFEERKGGPMARFNVLEFDVVEESAVSVPSNVDAEVELFSRGKLSSDLVKSHAKSLFDARIKSMPVTDKAKAIFEKESSGKGFPRCEVCGQIAKLEGTKRCKACRSGKKETSNLVRKMFDIATQRVEPTTMECDWAARYIGCSVKDLHIHSTSARGIMVGGFLKGLELACQEFQCSDTRNIKGESESPPVFETKEIDSSTRQNFLVEGIRFWHGEGYKIVTRVEPYWDSQQLVVYAEEGEQAQKIIDDAWEWLAKNNPLKGQAFALTGSWISKSGIGWDDVFLEKKIEDSLKRTVRVINEKGIDAANRGLILSGPPGTGKTLSARVMLNETKNTTFIWVSPKDFYRGGGFMEAFSLARQLAPTVLMFEDIDNWIDRYSVDLIKAEMDGLQESTGVVTILTTNFPDQLPAALIDRPGRFHDVLEIHLPSKDVRLRMLQKWAADATLDALAAMAEETEGYSGAHVYELCSFAKVLKDEDGSTLDEALTKAFAKVKDQRELINQNQLAGSSYRPSRRDITDLVAKGWTREERITEGGIQYRLTKGVAAMDTKIGDVLPMIGPIPHEGEAAADFQSRCILDPTMLGNYPTVSDRESACRILFSRGDGIFAAAKPTTKEVGTCKECSKEMELNPQGLCAECARKRDAAGYDESGQPKSAPVQIKAGRVLSKRNIERLSEALKRHQEGIERIKGVLDDANPTEEVAPTEPGANAPLAGPDHVMTQAVLLVAEDRAARDKLRKAIDAFDLADEEEQKSSDYESLFEEALVAETA